MRCLAHVLLLFSSVSFISVQLNAQPLTASVVVDTTQKIRNAPPSLYGTNMEWTYSAWGAWNSSSQAPASVPLGLAKNLGVSLIRFPGGVFADYYHWATAVGPQSSRKLGVTGPGDPGSAQTFGTDEALTFASQSGGQLLITVNLISGTPQEAAQWVKYANAKSERVVYWELGNEPWAIGSPTALTAGVYASRFLQFAQAMRAVDPKIKLGASGGQDFGSYVFMADPNWDKTVLQTAGSQIDFIAIHNSYAPLIFQDPGTDLRSVYSAMLAMPVQIKSNLDAVSEDIQRWAPQRASQIEVAVTEWGPYYSSDPTNRFVDHVKTVGSALYTASVMKAFLESPRVSIANAFKLIDNAFMGWIGMRNGQYVAKAPYYAMQMFTKHFGTTVVSTQTQSPVFYSAGVGAVDGTANVPYLEAVSSLDLTGKTLSIVVINKNFDSPITTSIQVKGAQPQGPGTLWTLNGTGIDANTGTQLPYPDQIPWAVQAQDSMNPQFYKGAAGQVGISSTAITVGNPSFTMTFPAHSITSLQLTVK